MKKFIFVVLLMCFAILPLFAKAQQAAGGSVLATVNGKTITEQEVLKLAAPQLAKFDSQLYEIKRGVLDNQIDRILLEDDAKKQGLTADKLRAQIMSKIPAVTEAEAQAFFETNKKRFAGKTFEVIKTQLIADLGRQKKEMAVNEYIGKLRSAANIQVNMERPRAKVSAEDDPGKGNKNAPVVFIEFSDFQCPYCQRARPAIQQIIDTYKDKVYYVFRDFPLSFHSRAKIAANAAQCANEGGKYWEYSSKLWDNQATILGNRQLTDEQLGEKLKELATELGVGGSKFNACYDSNKYFKEIDKDQEDGIAAGVSGTPAYFINGIPMHGLQQFESFKEVIDEELKK